MSTSTSPRTQCPHCQKVLKLKSDSLFGRQTACPKCRQQFKVKPFGQRSRSTAAGEDTTEMAADDTAVWGNDFNKPKIARTSTPSRRRSPQSRPAAEEDDYGFGNTLPAPSRRRKRSPSQQDSSREKNPKPRKKKKRKRRPTGPSPFVQFLAWFAGSMAAGLLGAIIWGGIITATQREFGIVAWGVGGLTGFGAAVAGTLCGDSAGFGSGLTAAFCSLGAIFIGKVIGITFLVGDAVVGVLGAAMFLDPVDGIFILLAFFTAYRVGAGISGDD